MYYFTSNIVTPSITLFMGEDKHENEELIKWGKACKNMNLFGLYPMIHGKEYRERVYP